MGRTYYECVSLKTFKVAGENINTTNYNINYFTGQQTNWS
jgi:hypothetical protein